MFTGLIEEVGTMRWIRASESGTHLQLAAPGIAGGVRTGDSVAVNGCCLTVAGRRDDQLTFDLLAETLRCTNLGVLRRDDDVNLERALRADSRLGGHFVQGHVDGTARVVAFDEAESDFRFEVELAKDAAQYVVAKGSIAINGISLTVAEAGPESLVIWVIPHTYQNTNLKNVRAGALVNVEFDLLAKYVERMLPKPC